MIVRRLPIALIVLAVTGCAEADFLTVGTKVDALPDSLWAASEWISAADAPLPEGVLDAPGGASWFFTEVSNEKRVESVRWMTTGLGVYELYLNGLRVGEEFLKPGFTHVEKTRRSFTYDITEYYRKKAGAANELSAAVTPGWWADRVVTPGWYGRMVGERPAFRSVLEIVYADGDRKILGTDTEHWTAAVGGAVTQAGIFDGETYDASVSPEYPVGDARKAPVVNTEFTGEILPSEGAEVYLRRDLALKPVRAYVWKKVQGVVDAEKEEEVEHGTVVVDREYRDGETIVLKLGETLVVDFGQNAAAVPYFTFKAAEGTKLTCLPGEMLNDGNGAERRGMDGPEGSIHRRNLRDKSGNWFRLEYTFGRPPVWKGFLPRFTFYGYRYISVTATGEVRFKSIASIPVSSITREQETGTLTTGDTSVNRLIANAWWGQLSNYLSVPTDCPQRDERNGWMADTQVFAETGTFFARTDSFFRKWMRDVRDSQSGSGSFPSVCPPGSFGRNAMRLGWADAGIIVPWTVWKQFGDRVIVDENWEAMERFMDLVAATKYDHAALSRENGNSQYADWLSYESVADADKVTYWNFLSATYLANDAGMMRDMALATGRDTAKYEAMLAEAKDYLKTQFMNPDGTFKVAALNSMQTPVLFALKNRLVEGEARETMLRSLRENFAAHGGCLQTGFLGTSVLMQTLTDNGLADIAWDLLFQRKNPSWLYSVDNGATTIWERWNSYTVDGGMGPNGMNSFNHYAYGCVCQWLWETAAGINADPADPGFRHIILKPVPDKRLGHLEASYRSAAGLIKSSWRYEGDTWTWTFTIPEGATATVCLPGGDGPEDYAAGTYTVRR